ncbi:MAG: S41 family peptidase [Treponema sp.]|nr:S41 family peptidase [Treponema sp.]
MEENNNKPHNKRFFRIAVISIVLLTSGLFVSYCFAQSNKNSQTDKISQYYKNIIMVFNYIKEFYVEDIDPQVLYEGAMDGMLKALEDPYTVYLDSQDMRGMTDTTNGKFYGVGLSISKRSKSTAEDPAYVDVIAPIENTPGFKAGIQSGDKLIEINGEPTPPMSMEDVLSKLRGPKGEPVEVTVLRGASVTFKKVLIRDLVEVPVVESCMIGNYGYVRLIQFTPETAPKLKEAIENFESKKYTGLILDLRGNPGGLLSSAYDIGNFFIDEGPVVSTKSRIASENKTFSANARSTIVKNKPVIVLINKGSASASEIVAGALKDNHIAYLVGERTYGKGSVQQVVPLNQNDGAKLTVARYYTPSDTNIDKIGIPPDREIKYPEYTDEQTKSFLKLSEDRTIEHYVKAHPAMTENDIANYASVLQSTYNLDLRLLRRLIRVECNRTKKAPIYDLDYDVQLVEAINILREGNFKKLVRSTKTLKELQEIAEKEEAAKKDAAAKK